MKKPIVIFSLCFLLWPALSDASDFSAHMTTLAVPQKMPPLVFEDNNGAQHSLSDYKGRYVLLNFWATWCAPCVKEMPSLDALQKTSDPKKLQILTVSEDRGDAVVSSFYKTHAITHLPILIDQAGIAPSTLHLDGLPTTLLINPQGMEIAHYEGDADWASRDVSDYLRSYIR